MKSASAQVKKLLHEGIPVYTYASITAKRKSDGVSISFFINPSSFSVSGNSITENGGNNFPIGNAISKSISLSIQKKSVSFDGFDLNGAKVLLSSYIYPDGIGSPSTRVTINEGTFYISDVKASTYTIDITAYDCISVLDTPFIISNLNPGTQQPIYANLWAYFVHLCDDVYREKKGLPSGSHYYSDHLSTSGIKDTLSAFEMDAIAARNEDKTTLRDVFGYIAQVVGGNIVLDEYEKIDIIEYDVMLFDYINGMRFTDNVTDVYDGGDFTETVSDSMIAYYFTTEKYILLDRYTDPPSIEYNDVIYDKVEITYPRPNTTDGSASYGAQTPINTMSLYNPLLQKTANDDYRVRAIAQNILNNICPSGAYIKPFQGSFFNNPLIEFMDNVILIDTDGVAYNSFVGEHTMNYLGSSDISNNTPTIQQNNRKFY